MAGSERGVFRPKGGFWSSCCFLLLSKGTSILIGYSSLHPCYPSQRVCGWIRGSCSQCRDLRNSHQSATSSSLHPLLVSASTLSRAHGKLIRLYRDALVPPEAVEHQHEPFGARLPSLVGPPATRQYYSPWVEQPRPTGFRKLYQASTSRPQPEPGRQAGRPSVVSCVATRPSRRSLRSRRLRRR